MGLWFYLSFGKFVAFDSNHYFVLFQPSVAFKCPPVSQLFCLFVCLAISGIKPIASYTADKCSPSELGCQLKPFIIMQFHPGLTLQVCDPSTGEAKVERLLSLRTAWSTYVSSLWAGL